MLSVRAFRELVESGVNSADKIGRIRDFTANDFFRACKLGYESIGKVCEGMAPSELYRRYADGRDEGLTGRGYGLNAGPGIDFDDPKVRINLTTLFHLADLLDRHTEG